MLLVEIINHRIMTIRIQDLGWLLALSGYLACEIHHLYQWMRIVM